MEDEDFTLGFALGEHNGQSAIKIEDLYVVPNLQSHGIATRY